MKTKNTLSRSLLLLIMICCLCSCASDGKKAAKEVINAARRGDGEQAKELLMKYGDTLTGEDYVDFCEELENAGVL